jgi:putative aldouronate transport system permease protein
VVPLAHIVAVSFSERAATSAHWVSIWPIGFNTANYDYVLFRSTQFFDSAKISIMRVLGATPLTVLVTVLAAYPLSLPNRFPGKQLFKWMIIFSMLFSGGLIPLFLVVKQLGLINSIWALILPGLVGGFNIILAINFFRSLPGEMRESAQIDGASHWDILFRIYLPVSLPVIATITLFTAIGHWNAWFDGLIYMANIKNYPLMTYLQTQTISPQALTMSLAADPMLFQRLSDRAMRGAQIVLTILPILVLYPFLQKYFVHGLTIGSVKG